MTIKKVFHTIAVCAGCLFFAGILAASTHAAENPTVFSIGEKDLFHYYAASPNPAVPCVTFTAAGLPPASTFDAATGLFTWLPDYGSAGSHAVSFGCADDPAAPGTQEIAIDVTPVTPLPLQPGTTKVTLLASQSPADAKQENDQKSLAAMLGLYGLVVENVADLSAPLAASTTGNLLVVPSYMAKALPQGTVDQVVSFVSGGGSILLFGRSPLSEALGISYSGAPETVTQFVDFLNPRLPLTWGNGEDVVPFTTGASDSILAIDKETRHPLIMARSKGAGRILYVGTDYYDHLSPYGTKGHPYLPYHVMDAFRLKPRLAAGGIDAYFDPGNYDLSQVYVEDIVRLWADRGIGTVYAAAWHFWVDENTGAEWNFGYQHFIDVCHQRGIKVYPWFAFPHVSQKFWFTKPECREQTAGNGTTYEFWRLNVNLQNQACLSSALDFMDSVVNGYDWDGINLTEIYYDYGLDVNFFTPMNTDFRNDYALISGLDPAAFFDPASPHYYQVDTLSWNQFLQYRTEVVTDLHKVFMDRLAANPKNAGHEIILTAVDNLHYNYYDVHLPPGVTTFPDTGVDLAAIMEATGDLDYTLQVEDPWPFWSSNPLRYTDFKKTYQEQFPAFKADQSRLFFDVNIVVNAHNPSAGPQPLYDFPSELQTGMEFSLMLKDMLSGSGRLALFSEHSVEPVDLARLEWALAGDSSITGDAAGPVSFTVKRTTKLKSNPTYYSVNLDGKVWPAWSAVDGTVLLPVGSHQLAYSPTGVYSGIKLSAISCDLVDAGILPGGITVSYRSPRQKAVLTIEAFDKNENEPFRVLVDGSVYAAAVYPFFGQYHLFLPKGAHTVQIEAVHPLALPGDCDSGGTVTIAEVQAAINMFLGLKWPMACVDRDGSGDVSIAETQKTINSFLGI